MFKFNSPEDRKAWKLFLRDRINELHASGMTHPEAQKQVMKDHPYERAWSKKAKKTGWDPAKSAAKSTPASKPKPKPEPKTTALATTQKPPKGKIPLWLKNLGGPFNMLMNAWLVYELGKAGGLFGAEGEEDAAFMGAYEAGMTPALQEQQAVASEMMKQRTGTRQMEGMAGFAQRKQDAMQTTSTMLDRELDDLLAGKAGLLSKASLMPDTTAQALSHVVNTGLL